MDIKRLAGAARTGCISEALRLCEQRDGIADGERRVIYSETLLLAGEFDRCSRAAAALEKSAGELSASQHARVALVQASLALEVGDLTRGMELLRRTMLLAEQAHDYATLAISAAHTLERSPHTKDQESVSLASKARRFAVRAGDPHVSARVHVAFAHIEGRLGRLNSALRHLTLAENALKTEWCAWIGAAINVDRAAVMGLLGDYETAVTLARTAAAEASSCGWLKGQALSALNLAYMCVMLGDEKEASNWIRRVPERFLAQPAYRIAIAETLAQAEFCKGYFQAAEEMLAQSDFGAHESLRWYELSSCITRCRIALAKNDWVAAERWSETGLELASKLHNRNARAELMLCRAEAMAERGLKPAVMDLLPAAAQAGAPDLLATAYIVRGKSLLKQGNESAGSDHIMRGVRILRSVGSSPAKLRGELAMAGVSPNATRQCNTTFESAVTLLELAGHPHVLGPEAFALLAGSRCAAVAALVVFAPRGVRIVEALGWTAAEARTAAGAPDGLERLPIGQRGDEEWVLLVRPCPEIEAYCTFAAIRRLLEIARSLDRYSREEQQRTALWPTDALEADPDAIWTAEQTVETLAVARRIAPSPLSVLITGETGTGKEMLARAIHRASDRAERPFLPFNCTAVPRDMLDSQLFGFRKGAFTGADTAFPGVIRAAAGGTLFLDEIAEIGPDLQPKLLRFLESHEIHPLGEPHPMKVDVRIVAATNAAIEQLVAAGRFREDLFYRLNVVRLTLPPLRERREEIPPLVQHYLRRYGEELRKSHLTVSDETLEYLLLFSWPGNVRQLANEVRRMAALAEPDTAITPALLSPEILASRRTIPATPEPEHTARVALDQPLPAAVDELEQIMVRRALDQTHGRVDEAARRLGISRKGLFLKRRRWGLPTS